MENKSLKKTIFVILLYALFFQNAYSQIEFGEEQIIEQENGFVHVHAGDLDGDDDEDVIACRYERLIWYENDGLGNFVNTQIIVEEEGSMQSIYITDLDGDNDLDILTDSNQDWGENDQIVWFKNDGAGNFSSKIIITDQINAAHCVYAADLDGDGRAEIITGANKVSKPGILFKPKDPLVIGHI
ncbi:MAG: VCBS repeat-containing protein [Candidatus Moranbacteria bacterium]|nr:VCBS repeat-containing protein [Candidatus Moranbacteria bacterium]